MKRIIFFALVVVLVGFASGPRRARAAVRGTANKKPFVNGQCVVVPAAGASIDRINAEYGSTTISQADGAYLVQLPDPTKTRAVIRDMRSKTYIQAAGTNTFVATPSARRAPNRHPTQTFPNDLADGITLNRTGYDTQEYLDYLNINEMTGPRGSNVTIAVIDTGADFTHPDLANHFVPGADFVDDDDDPSEAHSSDPDADFAYGHGTFIAGIIAKIAPDARIMPIRAIGPDGVGTTFDVIRAVDFAVANHAQIISMSFGAPEKLDGLDAALANARDRAVLVAAAGNQGTDREKQYPAEESFVVAVAAVNEYGVKTSFSNYGSLVDLAAPGDHIVSTYPGGKYATWSGTSFAAPMVAATAALVASHQGTAFDVGCVEDTLGDTSRSLDNIPANDRFRGKIGRLVDPAAAFNSPGCSGAFTRRVDLIPTARNDRSSEGQAERVINGDKQEFEVEIDGVPNGQYTLRVTTTGGTIVTDTFSASRGQARLEYSSDPGGDERALPSDLIPVGVIQLVEIVRSNGTVILSGDFADGTGGVGGGDDGGGDDGDGDDGGGDDGGNGGGDDGGGDDGGTGGDDGGGDTGGGGDDGGGSQQLEERVDLAPVGSDADASGRAEWRVDGTRQRFKVQAESVDPGEYQVFVDGALVGTISVDGSGEGELEFDSSQEPLPSALDPVTDIATVDVRLGSETILSGSF